jgi:CRP-like cAMP-binding protein
MAILDVLKGSVVFNQLNAEQLLKLAEIASEENHPAGALLYKEGERADKFYIVQKGKVVLDMEADIGPHNPPTQATAVDVVSAGRAMGWSALIYPHIYTLGAFCAEDSSLITIDAQKLRELLLKDTALGFEVMSAVAELIASRLTQTHVLLISERALNLLKS